MLCIQHNDIVTLCRFCPHSSWCVCVCVCQLSWSELNKKMMEPVEPRHSRQAVVEQQMVAIHNAADWEVDLAPGLLLQVVDLTPYVNTSALKVRVGGLWQDVTGRAPSSTRVCMLHEGSGLLKRCQGI